jgi:hypothetical protein
MTWNCSVSEYPFETIFQSDGSSKTVLHWLGHALPDVVTDVTVLFPGHGNLKINNYCVRLCFGKIILVGYSLFFPPKCREEVRANFSTVYEKIC